jgi:hypothetical protein
MARQSGLPVGPCLANPVESRPDEIYSDWSDLVTLISLVETGVISSGRDYLQMPKNMEPPKTLKQARASKYWMVEEGKIVKKTPIKKASRKNNADSPDRHTQGPGPKEIDFSGI